jgi:hypothetical protein
MRSHDGLALLQMTCLILISIGCACSVFAADHGMGGVAIVDLQNDVEGFANKADYKIILAGDKYIVSKRELVDVRLPLRIRYMHRLSDMTVIICSNRYKSSKCERIIPPELFRERLLILDSHHNVVLEREFVNSTIDYISSSRANDVLVFMVTSPSDKISSLVYNQRSNDLYDIASPYRIQYRPTFNGKYIVTTGKLLYDKHCDIEITRNSATSNLPWHVCLQADGTPYPTPAFDAGHCDANGSVLDIIGDDVLLGVETEHGARISRQSLSNEEIWAVTYDLMPYLWASRPATDERRGRILLYVPGYKNDYEFAVLTSYGGEVIGRFRASLRQTIWSDSGNMIAVIACSQKREGSKRLKHMLFNISEIARINEYGALPEQKAPEWIYCSDGVTAAVSEGIQINGECLPYATTIYRSGATSIGCEGGGAKAMVPICIEGIWLVEEVEGDNLRLIGQESKANSALEQLELNIDSMNN